MLSSLWNLVKALGIAAYRNTWGLISRCAKHADEGKADAVDKHTAGRIVTYLGLMLFAYALPQFAIMLSIFRSLVVMDVVGMIGSIFLDAASIYTTLEKETACGGSEASSLHLSNMAST